MGAMQAKMRNIGEACTAANRFYVHSSVADEFARRLGERMAALPIGRGVDDGVVVGPLIDADARDKVASLVDDAVRRGAEVVVGGKPLDGEGYFYPPTVLTNVPGGRPDAARRDLRASRPVGDLRDRGRRRSPAPTTPSTAWPPTSSPATSTVRSGSASDSRPA